VPSDFARRLSFAIAFTWLCAGGAVADMKPDISQLIAGPITVESQPITTLARFGPDHPLAKLKFMGGLVLTSPSPYFGGWSGLLLDDDAKSFVALSDASLWMRGELAYSGSRLSGIKNARLGPLLEKSGRPIVRASDRDSESIALEIGSFQDGWALIGFEGRHRIERFVLSSDGFKAAGVALPIPPAAKRMDRNEGFEALTIMKGGPYKGWPIAFSEHLFDEAGNHTGWLWTKDGPRALHLKNVGEFDITDVSSLDDGTLFILERAFNWLEGVKMRLVKVEPDAPAPGRTLEGEELIEADMNDNVDNMEGLAVTWTKSGDVLITMISDDNFNHIIQRTLLLQFLLRDSEQAKARQTIKPPG
jgi:hypothetical protein